MGKNVNLKSRRKKEIIKARGRIQSEKTINNIVVYLKICVMELLWNLTAKFVSYIK